MKVTGLQSEVESEWRDNIAPFWMKHALDSKHDGFLGSIDNDLRIDERAEKGVILNSRILWTFSRAYKLYRNPAYAKLAERAYAYLSQHFIDRQFGGVFWTVDYQGMPANTKKRPYAQAFALYGLSEFYLATGEGKALDEALGIFSLVESRCRDQVNDGYFETFERDWTLSADQRLSDVDQDEMKSMNTHLHLLEAYSSLFPASGEGAVKERLRALVDIFLKRVIHPQDPYLQMFFDEAWVCKSPYRSFGHDIEASWLLCEAAEALADADLSTTVRAVARELAQSVYDNGLDEDGGLLYEADASGITNDEKHWWVQAEAVVGFVNTFMSGGGAHFMEAANRVWGFISGHIIDKENGEWFWKTSRTGVPSHEMPKLSQWKCPYHNGRMCFEIRRRLTGSEEEPGHGLHGV